MTEIYCNREQMKLTCDALEFYLKKKVIIEPELSQIENMIGKLKKRIERQKRIFTLL